MPKNIPYVFKQNIMSYEEILSICSIMSELGVKAVRVTGGEPLNRRGCVGFLRQLKAVSGIERVSLTTNATLLEPHIEELAKLGLFSINISLNSLDDEIYHRITGQNMFESVWSNIEKALEFGLNIKINCVLVEGFNESEILPLTRLALRYPISVRFIELMPTEVNASLKGVFIENVLDVISAEFNLKSDITPYQPYGHGPAKYFKSDGMKGNIGFISALSDNFCESCNRVRLSSEGYLKLCLHRSQGLNLRKMLRSGASDEEIKKAIEESIALKPKSHRLKTHTEVKNMSQIGG